jgi:hypothetical protein
LIATVLIHHYFVAAFNLVRVRYVFVDIPNTQCTTAVFGKLYAHIISSRISSVVRKVRRKSGAALIGRKNYFTSFRGRARECCDFFLVGVRWKPEVIDFANKIVSL